MSLIKSVSAAAAVAILASAANAAIVPSWRVNTISSAAVTAEPALANAVSLSLMVELSGGSLYNVSGLYVAPNAFGSGSSFTVYQNSFGTNTDKPNPALIPVFPALEFDSYVSTTNPSGTAAAAPGTYSGVPGSPVFGPNQFDVAWGATPNTGGTGQLEIARLTLIGSFVPGSTPVPGEVRENTNPNLAVPIPPLPIAIPEPATLGLAALGLGLAALRRR